MKRRENGHRIEWVEIVSFCMEISGENGVKESCQKFGEDKHDVCLVFEVNIKVVIKKVVCVCFAGKATGSILDMLIKNQARYLGRNVER